MDVLPAEKFSDAIDAIEAEARTIVGQHENIIIFIEYLRRQWLPVASKVSVYNSVYDCGCRQNALTESMNGQLFRALGGRRPRLLVFLGNIKILCRVYRLIILLRHQNNATFSYS